MQYANIYTPNTERSDNLEIISLHKLFLVLKTQLISTNYLHVYKMQNII